MIHLFSPSRDSEIIIEINDLEEAYSDYTITAQIQAGRNTFTGRNDGIHFSNYANFLRDFRDFLASREGCVLLEAAEECWIKFFRWNNKGDVGIKFKITKYVYFDGNKMGIVAMEGEFELDSEYLNQIQIQFEKIEMR